MLLPFSLSTQTSDLGAQKCLTFLCIFADIREAWHYTTWYDLEALK